MSALDDHFARIQAKQTRLSEVWDQQATENGPRLRVAGMISGETCGHVHSPKSGPFWQSLADAGFTGVLLDDCGFPKDIRPLNAALRERSLVIAGAGVSASLSRHESHAKAQQEALQAANALVEAFEENRSVQTRPPALVLYDCVGENEMRNRNAGRTVYGMGLTEDQWITFASGINAIAKTVLEETGIKTLFRPHPATFVETPWELETLMRLTHPGNLGIYLDTGFYSYAGGDPLAVLDQFAGRIGMVQVRDFSPDVAWYGGEQQWDFHEQKRRGIFCQSGQGRVPFAELFKKLDATGYAGWIVAEATVAERDYLRFQGI